MKPLEIKNTQGNIAKVFAKTFEYEAYEQIKTLFNYEPYLDSKIRIMPDAHVGKGCTIGTTMTLTDKVTPNLVGVDIGCGMLCGLLGGVDIDLEQLDKVINSYIPSGFNIRETPIRDFALINELRCINHIDTSRALLSIGTLGGGNHFIELNKDNDDNKYLVIHSGSRNLGVQVCKYYQEQALALQSNDSNAVKELITKLKREGREKEIENAIRNIKKPQVNKDLAYLEGDLFNDYIHDIGIVQKYATINRYTIFQVIIQKMNIAEVYTFETIHNYIDTEHKILRKGAVSAKKDELLIIPMNMRDGSLICIGKGNEDWNYSAPHGAGRLMSRSKAKQNISIDEFKDVMQDVYSTSICESTIDEAPQAYKPMDEIIDCIEDTCDMLDIIKPIYNFKSN